MRVSDEFSNSRRTHLKISRIHGIPTSRTTDNRIKPVGQYSSEFRDSVLCCNITRIPTETKFISQCRITRLVKAEDPTRVIPFEKDNSKIPRHDPNQVDRDFPKLISRWTTAVLKKPNQRRFSCGIIWRESRGGTRRRKRNHPSRWE